MISPDTPDVPARLDLPDVAVATFRWGAADAPPSRTVVAVHGITATSRAWPAVARALPPDWALVAPDLRGRGASRDLPHEGLDTHVADVVALGRALDPDATGDLVLAGHSMGAYVAVLTAAAAPGAFRRVVLVDGGVPLPVPADADLDALLDATLGPAILRLATTFADEEAYVDDFRVHPALAPSWSDDVETYARYGVVPVDGGVRSHAVEDAVRADGRGLLAMTDRIDAALRGLPVPTTLLTAPSGMFGEPPGLLPAAAVTAYDEQVAALTAVEVPGTNHYTVLFADDAVNRVAAAITEE